MAATRVIPAFDEFEDRDGRFDLSFEMAALEQFAFKGGEEAFAHGVVEAALAFVPSWAGQLLYKVDRLTRSLADFTMLVELFDAQGASFAALTQQFNATSSTDRLTLNYLSGIQLKKTSRTRFTSLYSRT